ncbi:hypothetical protein [Desulfovibrio aminophilus]|uniref:hypothetical protein n=1 Tax=Desulfovibrio aminophilus TaxID=81425 RepID=UPI00339733D4
MFEEGIYGEESGRVRVERGPVSLVLSAWKGGSSQPEVCLRAAGLVDDILKAITAVLPSLSRPWPQVDPGQFLRAERGSDALGEEWANADAWRAIHLVPLRMWEAARDTEQPEMTPLCAVAGAVSDSLADIVFAILGGMDSNPEESVRVVVSNGGDVSLRLTPGTMASVGLVPALSAAGADEVVTIREEDPVRGVATSGLGGRGLTQGVADAVTVFAGTGALADALATRLCNASRLESPRVRSVPAGLLRPGCDIARLPVTAQVGVLTREEKETALAGITQAAKPLFESGKLHALRASVQGMSRWFPEALPANNSGGFHGRADSQDCHCCRGNPQRREERS